MAGIDEHDRPPGNAGFADRDVADGFVQCHGHAAAARFAEQCVIAA
ncbi:hypothetical protein G7076_08515 [Sphingomonas sp. HDW15A]|nr:hypothetical protein [Sphingomonas sp. HDW15A]QIK96478.1 hypothetical protein G7076_08515 [Sphingomonas sp. HDW15A]